MSNPKVSVIIPLYNQEKYFEKCISSVSAQTYKNIEIIIVNDGSTDNSLAIAQKWSQKDNRITVIDKKNEGLSRARKDGFKMATGDFFTPVDSDDYLPKNAIEILVRHILENNVDVVLGSATKVLGWIKQTHSYDYGFFPYHQVVKQPELYDKYYHGFFGKACFPITIWAHLYRMSTVKRAQQETELWTDELPFVGEDHFFNMKLFPYLRSMYRTDETVYYYRYGGMSSSHFSPGYTDLLKLSDLRLNILEEKGLSKECSPLFEEYADCVYYHVQQLIEYKKADKRGILAFIKKEMTTRSIALRLIEYYSVNKTQKKELLLMTKHDYEGMYNHAYELMKKRRRSLKNRLVRICMRVIEIIK